MRLFGLTGRMLTMLSGKGLLTLSLDGDKLEKPLPKLWLFPFLVLLLSCLFFDILIVGKFCPFELWWDLQEGLASVIGVLFICSTACT